MRIDLFNSSASELSSELASQKVNAEKAAKSDLSGTEDRATLTSDSASVGSLASTALSSPEVRQGLVDSLKQSVNSGQYELRPWQDRRVHGGRSRVIQAAPQMIPRREVFQKRAKHDHRRRSGSGVESRGVPPGDAVHDRRIGTGYAGNRPQRPLGLRREHRQSAGIERASCQSWPTTCRRHSKRSPQSPGSLWMKT